MTDDKNWSTATQIDQQTSKCIHMTDDPALGSAWLFQNAEEADMRFWAPDRISNHSTATYQLSWWVLINDIRNSSTIWYKHTHGWGIGYWSRVNQITPINLQKITMTDNLAVKPPWLMVSEKKQWGVRFLCPESTRYHLSKSKSHPSSYVLTNSNATGHI